MPLPNSGFAAVAAGAEHALALKADGSMIVWGRNTEGQCNVPSPNTGFVALGAGRWHSLAIRLDSDGDAVPDVADSCPNTIPGAQVDLTGCPSALPGDFDRDGDVDEGDFDVFTPCDIGAGVPLVAGCEAQDFDHDADVDQDDFGTFQRCYSGEGIPADPACAN